jgi:hypothetical protein
MLLDTIAARICHAKPCKPSMQACLFVAALGAFSASSPALSAETGTYVVASQVVTIASADTGSGSALHAIGGTRLRAIGVTTLRAEDSEELQAIGGTFLRAIGATRLRAGDDSSEQLAIGLTRLRSDDESAAQAIGGTRLRAIGGTRLRSEDSSELVAIGGTRLRAIGGTRLRSDETDSAVHAIGGTRLRAIGGTRLRSDDVQFVQAIGGTRLRAIEDSHDLNAIGGTRLRAIEDGSSVEAIGGTRLRAIGGTRLRAIGGTRLRSTNDSEPTIAATNSPNLASSEQSAPVALLVDVDDTIDVFAYGPVTAISADPLQISVLGQVVDLTGQSNVGTPQLGQVAIVAGSSRLQDGIIVWADEWHVPGSTNVSVFARVIDTNPALATFTLEGGITVNYSNILSTQYSFEAVPGTRVLVSGVAY